MKKIKMIVAVVFVAFITFGTMSNASALTIDPFASNSGDTSYLDVANYQWSGFSTDSSWDPSYLVNPNSAADIAYVTGTSFTGSEVWYGGENIDPDMDITDNISIGGATYMVVKDGNHDPMWYIFNLTGLWDGEEDLHLTNFWPDEGNISHVAIYTTRVPEPLTLILLGFGLVGLAGIRRRIEK